MPSTTTSMVRFYYVYVLESLKDRLEAHNKGLSFATAPRRPFKFIYFESCLNYQDAHRREHYLKTTGGRRFLAKRLREYYNILKL